MIPDGYATVSATNGSFRSVTTSTSDCGSAKVSAPFLCKQCGKWWQTFRYNVSCCVYHGGWCCHFNDREVEPVK